MKKTNTCESCKYFSDTVVKWHTNGQTCQVLCLHKDSPHYMHYQPSTGTCRHFHIGVPIDVRHQP